MTKATTFRTLRKKLILIIIRNPKPRPEIEVSTPIHLSFALRVSPPTGVLSILKGEIFFNNCHYVTCYAEQLKTFNLRTMFYVHKLYSLQEIYNKSQYLSY